MDLAGHPLSKDLGFALAPRYATDDALFGEWRCDNPARGLKRESFGFFTLWLGQIGSHLHQVERERVIVSPLGVAFHAAGEPLRVGYRSLAPQASAVLVMRDAALAPMLARGPGLGLTRHGAPLVPRAALIAARLAHAAVSDDPVAFDGLALALVHAALSSEDTAPPGRHAFSHARAEDMLHFMTQHYRRRLSLSAIAAAAGLSPFYASRVFRARFGLSPHRALTRLRLRAALAELPRYRDRLTALALDVGFSSHAHFSAAFRGEYGVTPSAASAARDRQALLL